MTKTRIRGVWLLALGSLWACSSDDSNAGPGSSATTGSTTGSTSDTVATTSAATGSGGSTGTTTGSGGGAGVEPDAGEPGDDAAPDRAVEEGGSNDGGPGDGAARDGADGGRDSGAPDSQVAYDPCPPKGTPCIVLPLGDSITQGAGSTEPGGYRVELFHQAVSHGQKVTFVGSASSGPTTVDMVPFPRAHEGHGGYSINQLSDLVTTNDTIRTYKPDIVMLEIGTNNVRTPNDSGAQQVPNAIADLEKFVDKILASDSHLLLIVAQITPTQTASIDVRVKAYNAAIPDLVRTRAAQGKHIATTDNFSPFVADPNFRTDYFGSQVHPNAAGYVVLGDAWYAAVGPRLR